MKKGTAYTILIRVVPFLLAIVCRIWFFTCRIKVHGQEYREQVLAQDKSIIATIWHYSIIFTVFHMRKERAALLVSASSDGEFIARLARHFNYSTVRGSRHRRGLRALKELIALVDRKTNIGIVADGSKGPPLVVQSGAIYLASHAGAPIMPIVWSCSGYIRFNSWDRTVIPRPFCRIDFFYGKPFYVPPDLDAEQTENYRLMLEEELKSMYRKAWRLHGKEEH